MNNIYQFKATTSDGVKVSLLICAPNSAVAKELVATFTHLQSSSIIHTFHNVPNVIPVGYVGEREMLN